MDTIQSNFDNGGYGRSAEVSEVGAEVGIHPHNFKYNFDIFVSIFFEI
jgi:hypothetical protein